MKYLPEFVIFKAGRTEFSRRDHDTLLNSQFSFRFVCNSTHLSLLS